MAKKKEKMLNFPIALLQGFLKPYEAPTAMLNVLCYGAYQYGNASGENDYTAFMGGAAYLGLEDELKSMGIPPCCMLGEEAYHRFKGTPMTGISTDTLLDWYYNGETKSQRQKLTFLAFAACKSFFADGKKWFFTNEMFLFSRMDGRASPVIYSGDLSPELQPYCKTYWRREVLNDLQLDYRLKVYSTYGIRGFYLSFSQSIRQLVAIAEEGKRKSRIKKLEAEKREARFQFYDS